jgi:DNA-binding NarL/FixJ family response regulator
MKHNKRSKADRSSNRTQRVDVHIAICDPLAAYRRGLALALAEAGFIPEEPSEPMAWIDESQQAIIFTVASDRDYETIAALRSASPKITIVALLASPTPMNYRKTIEAGATVPADRCLPVEQLVAIVSTALTNWALLPTGIIWSVAVGAGVLPALSPPELGWLRALSQGTSVTALAQSVGYSRRQMHRELETLFRRLGVTTRAEALVKATELGILNRGAPRLQRRSS